MKSTFGPMKSAAFKAGMLGGLAMTIGMAIVQAWEMTPFSRELAFGALMTRTLDPLTWIIGFSMHLVVSGAVGLVYMAAFESLRRYGAGLGVIFGFVQWIVAGISMGLLPDLYALMPEMFGGPGFFGMDYGPINVMSNLVLHLVFGGIVGALYESARRNVVTGPSVIPLPGPVEDKEISARRAA